MVVGEEGTGMAKIPDDVGQRPARVRSFVMQPMRTLTGEGVCLIFGAYTFVLVNRDGTPERSLDKAGFQRVVEAVFVVEEGASGEGKAQGREPHGGDPL